MSHHMLCLTVDVDPDGMSARQPDRNSLRWEGFRRVISLPEVLEGLDCGRTAMTWFVRADNHLRQHAGSALYLLEEHDSWWAREYARGNELAWHPHLYTCNGTGDAHLVTDTEEACDQLESVWETLRLCSFPMRAFRNGEAWHVAATLATVERLGFEVDSTAVPGRAGPYGHPMDWSRAPNRPYFPRRDDPQERGGPRSILEAPMTTWLVRAPWDSAARLRYMNPAVHGRIFQAAVDAWLDEALNGGGVRLWVFISHPDELAEGPQDGLIAHSMDEFQANIRYLMERLRRHGQTFEFLTLSQAARRWRDTETAL